MLQESSIQTESNKKTQLRDPMPCDGMRALRAIISKQSINLRDISRVFDVLDTNAKIKVGIMLAAGIFVASRHVTEIDPQKYLILCGSLAPMFLGVCEKKSKPKYTSKQVQRKSGRRIFTDEKGIRASRQYYEKHPDEDGEEY